MKRNLQRLVEALEMESLFNNVDPNQKNNTSKEKTNGIKN